VDALPHQADEQAQEGPHHQHHNTMKIQQLLFYLPVCLMHPRFFTGHHQADEQDQEGPHHQPHNIMIIHFICIF
jgi:hypothetical protein